MAKEKDTFCMIKLEEFHSNRALLSSYNYLIINIIRFLKFIYVTSVNDMVIYIFIVQWFAMAVIACVTYSKRS